MDDRGAVLLDYDGDGDVYTALPVAWRGTNPPARVRWRHPNGSNYIIGPYEAGFAHELDRGTIEFWTPEFSVKGPRHGVPGSQWLLDGFDLGGAHTTAHGDEVFRAEIVKHNQGDPTADPDNVGEKHTRITSESLLYGSHGDLQLVVRNEDRDGISILCGSKDQEIEVARITGDGKVIAHGGLGVGNVEPAFKPHQVVGKTEAFDEHGNSLGYFAIFDRIT